MANAQEKEEQEARTVLPQTNGRSDGMTIYPIYARGSNGGRMAGAPPGRNGSFGRVRHKTRAGEVRDHELPYVCARSFFHILMNSAALLEIGGLVVARLGGFL